MDLKGKNVLLIGLAKTGISTIKLLDKLEANITVNDIKTEEKLVDILEELKDIKNATYILGYHPEEVDHIDLAVVSPGVPLDLPFIQKLYSNNIKVIGEVELAYQLSNNPTFIGITGTNGKTTTTSLVGEIFKAAKCDTYVVGNIGKPVIETVGIADEKSFLITELSSFQLESIVDFKPRVSMILNLSPDHLNRHHTMENYIMAKANIFKNQDKNDFTILNYDDEAVRALSSKCNSQVLYFSRKHQGVRGIYLNNEGNIVINIDKEIVLLHEDELSLPGGHNLENCMAATLAAYVSGIDIEVIREVLKTFKAVEHRLEYVKTVNGVMYVNDSKGTNPDSTIKAVTSYKKPIILIAGGYDKDSTYDELLDIAKQNVKALVLLGETASKIEACAKTKGFEIIKRVQNMKEAVETSAELANEGDVVLLSPACASWDMYTSFEVRGRDFKDNVNNL